MPILFSRRIVLHFWIAGAIAIGVTPRLAADLTWNPSTGWQVEATALAGLTGAQGRTALNLMNRARRAEEAGSRGTAIKEYEKVASKYQGSVFAPEALFRAAKILLQRRQYYKSFHDFQEMMRRYPNTKRFNEAVGEQYRIASALIDGAHNRAWGFLPLISNRTRGIEYFEVVLLNAPYSDYAPLALMDIARGNQYIKSTDDAIDALDRLVNTYPQSVLAPVAYLKLGDLHASLTQGPKYDQGATKEAMTYYEDYMILYPGDSNIALAAAGVDKMKTILAQSKIYIGDFYFYKRLNYTAAKVFYNEAITTYPDSSPARTAKKRLADLDSRINKDLVRPKAPQKKRFLLF
ncbi:MAG TPA: outer membrane protein assembly factor BamD [Opitutaceae bacterium]|nr:outer membrane protein assembly factor BamD [Opitutaceae bacterium]